MPKDLNHILYVDDEEDILEIATLSLSEVGGIRVTALTDVEGAIDRIGEINPDMILLDVMMPRVNGVQAIRMFRAKKGFSSIPIILMTAKIQPKEVLEYKEAGATSVIAKPFDPMTLADQVRAVWNEHYANG